ncbi:N-acetylmuramoyl-L-alanine amidase [Rhizobiaceae bacterium n13]|uniref:N-acetylmuramoyl-L-alanine amidase n=1 Tax=Ferirhizobium litorale TaxID=2927786 RepID=UPI0024B2B047|nr:N-acetylmuramoyl-L-alanine amidase [Fererhizobium litorale]MDI7865324.1 N-acetylmuramoyl-L-alanine amidase [Fererhizobium litorale]
MADRREYVDALAQTAATVMLLSGGGNDMLGGGRFASFLLPYTAGSSADDLLNVPLFEVELRKATDAYRRILVEVRQRFPRVRVFGHAYDVPHPQGEGRWIGKPLTERGIPLDIGRSIVESVLDRFAGQLRALQGEFSNFRFVDLRGKVDRGRSSWFDELHPKNPGYGRAAQAFREAIAELASEGALEFATGAHAGAAVPMTRMAPGVALPGFEAAGRVIVLDPGHGGAPPPTKVGGSSWNNAIGPDGTLEKTLTLDVAGRAKAILESHGYQVFLTRTGDINLSLAQRAAVARTRSAAVFVSIHFNASTGHNAQGTETFVHTNHTETSRRLCLTVQRAMVAELGLHDRNAGHPGGIKEGAFGVINGSSHSATTAAVLHEVSFLDRADEERKLKTEAYRDRIARALARGIETYLGAGVESFALETASDEIGDAIELGAFEAGQSVPAYLGVAEAATSEWIGGHALPTETFVIGASSGDLARQIAESLARDLGPGADDVGNDVHEFAYVDPGPGFNVSDMGRSVEADTGVLTSLFAGVESAGFDMARYEAFIRGLGLSHFVPAEFLFLGNSNAPGARCSGKNALPPENLWGNIAKTARMLDEIRKRLGAPIRILSCYRNTAYNTCVGGEPNSLHMRFNAIDWHCDAGTVDRWHQVAREVRQSNPQFAGGIGRYPRQGFIHVDTRGANADWG